MPREDSATRTRREREKEERRRQILDAAAHVFAENGSGAATMDQVAAEAELAKGTLYLYYATKTELLEAVLEDGADRIIDAERDAAERAKSTRDKLRAVAHAILDFYDRHPANIHLHIQEFVGSMGKSPSRGILLEKEREHLEFLKSIFEEGQRRGEVARFDVALLVNLFAGLLDRAFFCRDLLNTSRPLDEELDELIDILFHGAASPDEPRQRQTQSQTLSQTHQEDPVQS